MIYNNNIVKLYLKQNESICILNNINFVFPLILPFEQDTEFKQLIDWHWQQLYHIFAVPKYFI